MNLTDDTPAEYKPNRIPLVTEIVLSNIVTPSLNELNKWHWKKRNALRAKYETFIWAMRPSQHLGRVRIEIYRHSSGTLDDDNFRGGCKQLVDALKRQKVIVDDTDEYLREKYYQQVRILPGGPKMMVIILTDLF